MLPAGGFAEPFGIDKSSRPWRQILPQAKFPRQLHLHPAVTYVHVSSLGCKYSFLGLQAFSTLCQSVDFVNILRPRAVTTRGLGASAKRSSGHRVEKERKKRSPPLLSGRSLRLRILSALHARAVTTRGRFPCTPPAVCTRPPTRRRCFSAIPHRKAPRRCWRCPRRGRWCQSA